MPDVVEPRTGDLVLYAYQDTSLLKHTDSYLIAKGTHSPYSHIAVVLDDTTATQANPGSGARGDVQVFALYDRMTAKGSTVVFDLFRPTSTPADEARLRAYATKQAADSEMHTPGDTEPDQVAFSTAHAVGIGILHALVGVVGIPGVRQMVDALAWAMEDETRWLFCSEYAFRCLEQSGADFKLRRKPFVDLPSYLDLGWLILDRRRLIWRQGFVKRIIRELKDLVGWDADDDAGCAELWMRYWDGYVHHRKPARVSAADFCVPADFACSSSFRHIGQATGRSAYFSPPAAAYHCD